MWLCASPRAPGTQLSERAGELGPGRGRPTEAGRPPNGPVGAACPPWAFGPGCSEECRCERRNTRACDRRDGSCSCKAGFRGQLCQDGECGVWGAGGARGRLNPAGPLPTPAECPPGFFGPGCQQTCSCAPGAACDPVSGECGKQCPAGYQGRDCNQGGWLAPGRQSGWGAGRPVRAGHWAPGVLYSGGWVSPGGWPMCPLHLWHLHPVHTVMA